MTTINITLNKSKMSVSVEPNWTLHYVIHDRLGWTGIKEMCNGFGACGSCSVIINGRPVLACLTLAAECDGAVIETAEGASMSNTKLLDAYIYNYCCQCGYCTPGFLVTAKALLDRIPKPTEADIREALGGNICR
jgi:aerobic-type carbon monoxide dehydrogenase small subunit (CoxS/CutS family)